MTQVEIAMKYMLTTDHPVTSNELADATSMSKGSASAVLSKLYGHRYIRRTGPAPYKYTYASHARGLGAAATGEGMAEASSNISSPYVTSPESPRQDAGSFKTGVGPKPSDRLALECGLEWGTPYTVDDLAEAALAKIEGLR